MSDFAKDTNVPINDLISRQAVIDAIEQHKTEVLGEREWNEGIAYGYSAAHRHLVDVVKQLPSAQPEIKVERALTEEEIKNIKEMMADSPLVFMPSAKPEPQWIPCSERLPSKKEIVLITNSNGNVRCGQFRGTYEKYWTWKGNTLETVVAWMPLPEPWRGAER